MPRKSHTPPISGEGVSKARRKPDFTGVPGKIVAGDVVLGIEGRGLVWGQGHRVSPYDALLEDLKRHSLEAQAKGKPLPAIEFENPRARAAVCLRARKKGMRLICGELEGKLWVRIDNLQNDPAVVRRRNIAAALKKYGPLPAPRLAGQLREDGDSSIDAAQVTRILAQMGRSGEVVEQEGGSWRLAPGSAALAKVS